MVYTDIVFFSVFKIRFFKIMVLVRLVYRACSYFKACMNVVSV